MPGFVDHIYKAMLKKWEAEAKEWVRVSLSLRKDYHGSSFEDGSCKKLLENLHVFEDHLGNPKISAMTPYLEVVKLFNSFAPDVFHLKMPGLTTKSWLPSSRWLTPT